MLPIRISIALAILAGVAQAEPSHPTRPAGVRVDKIGSEGRDASAKPKHASPWDGRYILQSVTGGELCPKVGAMPLVVSGGAFSYPWRLQATTLVTVGTIDGAVARGGKATTTVKLDHPYPDAVASLSPGQLDNVKTVPVVFSGTKNHTAKLTLELGAKLQCSIVWATPGTPDPSDERTVTAPSRPSPPPKQAKPAPSAPPPERSRPARSEPSPPAPAPSPSPPPAPPRNDHRHSDCVSKCWSTGDKCKYRCEEDESTCKSRCDNGDGWGACLSKCSDDQRTCDDRCSDDSQSCVFACPSDD
jgi:hypothetical protein